jgi:hypothetical protein
MTTTPRLDLYAPIHKALRNFMTDTLSRIGRIDVFDSADMTAALAQLDALLGLCANHLQHENDFMHAAIEARAPGAAARVAGEHVQHLAAIDALRVEARQLIDTGNVAQRPSLALRLYRHLALFVAENFEHMHVEETQHNAALWAHYSDAELAELHGRLLASVPPHEMLEVARWMVPALSPVERAGMLNGAKADMPPHAFQALVGSVRPYLDGAAWAKLAPSIGVAGDPRLAQVG